MRRMKQSNRGTRTVRKKNIDDLENDEKKRKSIANSRLKSIANNRREEQSQPQPKRTKGLRPRQGERRCETVVRVDHSKDSGNQRGEGLQQIRD